jgi:hypothetical protein
MTANYFKKWKLFTLEHVTIAYSRLPSWLIICNHLIIIKIALTQIITKNELSLLVIIHHLCIAQSKRINPNDQKYDSK